MDFFKYQGAGNDFILIDDRDSSFLKTHQSKIPHLCHRQTGIGADGLILLQPSLVADIKMRIFNADGSEPPMCGNGLRCLVRFAKDLGWITKTALLVETNAGQLPVRIEETTIATRLLVQSPPILHTINTEELYVIHTGVPHGVLFTGNLKLIDVEALGKKWRHDPLFAPEGINVNFVSLLPDHTLHVRTYERGVEKETLACGTGMAACAFIAAHKYKLTDPIFLRTLGGDLLKAEIFGQEVELSGPAQKVFKGVFSF